MHLATFLFVPIVATYTFTRARIIAMQTENDKLRAETKEKTNFIIREVANNRAETKEKTNFIMRVLCVRLRTTVSALRASRRRSREGDLQRRRPWRRRRRRGA
jgi:hypothetical protein